MSVSSYPLFKLLATNATDSGFAARIATATAPTAAGLSLTGNTGGVLQLGSGGAPESLVVVPYGIGADNATMKVRVIGWNLISTLWVPVIICEVLCTLSTAVGVAAQPVLNTERFADTIAFATGFAEGNDMHVVAPATNVAAYFMCKTQGFGVVEIQFDINGSATSCNALVTVR